MDIVNRLTPAAVDALHTATCQLATERRALELCETNGWAFDAAFARREVGRLTDLVTRINRRAS